MSATTSTPKSSSAPSVSPSSQAPTPTAEPTAASPTNRAVNLPVPERPAAADEETKEGLEAFTGHWLQLLSYSYEANDLKPLQEASDPSCGFCQDAATAMAQIYQLGWASGGQTTVIDFATDFTPDSNGVYTADITTTQGEIFYYSGEGWLGSSESRPNTPHTVTARYIDNGWQLIDYTSPEVPPSEVPPSESAEPGH
jgi:hypothetical protein